MCKKFVHKISFNCKVTISQKIIKKIFVIKCSILIFSKIFYLNWSVIRAEYQRKKE